jgi:hypothetical protein
MKKSNILIGLACLTAALALVCSGAGLFWPQDGSPFSFTTLRGLEVMIIGQGLYHYDTQFRAPIFRGTDAVTFFVAVPLLIGCMLYARRGSLKSSLLLAGVLSFFLYNAASLALSAAYNPLFLVYIVYFSVSLFAFILAFTAVDRAALAASISPRLPRKRIAAFLFVAGLSVMVWLIEAVAALTGGMPAPDSLASYTTEVTSVIDIGVIFPTVYLAAILLLRRAPLGYPLAFVMITLNAIIGLVVAMQTIFQSRVGIALTVFQTAAYVAPFILMSLIAVSALAAILRHIQEPAAQ